MTEAITDRTTDIAKQQASNHQIPPMLSKEQPPQAAKNMALTTKSSWKSKLFWLLLLCSCHCSFIAVAVAGVMLLGNAGLAAAAVDDATVSAVAIAIRQ